MSDRDQQDECPKAFYCLPESCGDCPDQQLPCEGCPDPGMPCLGCPAVDEQATPLTADEQMSEWVGHPSDEPCGPRCDCGSCDEPEAPLPETMGEFMSRLGRAYAEGERAATERILERIDQSLHVYREHAGARGALYALRCRVADAIERGEHEQR